MAITRKIERSPAHRVLRGHAAAQALRVGGLTPLSATDWPGQLSAVVFCQGCPWRCSYCHNPHLLAFRGAGEISWQDVLAFLGRRAGLLDAVVFSGGEPLAQHALADAMRAVKRMGFGVEVVTVGPDAAASARTARLARLRAMTGTVEPGWERPDAVILAG